MRSADEPIDTFGVLPAKPAPAPKPQEPIWKPIERGSVIEKDQDGNLRTNIPQNKLAALDAWQC